MLGADEAGALLEVVVVNQGDDDERIIHAMPLRRAFYKFLPGRVIL